MVQKNNITVYLKKIVTYLLTYSVKWGCFSLKCRLPLQDISCYHAANEYFKTKE